MSEMMSAKEAAERWHVSVDTVRIWCRDGSLKSGTKPCEQDKPGSPWRIRRDAIPPTAKREEAPRSSDHVQSRR